MLKAFILAAGEGSRFAPYSRFMEKSMLPLGGKPVVRIIAERLDSMLHRQLGGIYIAVLQKHYDAFRHEFRDMPVEVKSFSGPPVGSAGAYALIAREVNPGPMDFSLVHYADTYTTIDYAKMYESFRLRGDKPLIAVTGNIHHDYSEVHYNSNNKVVEKLVEKPLLPYPTWTGIIIFTHGDFHRLMPVAFDNVDFGYDILPRWVKEERLSAYMSDAAYFDTGNIRSYEQARDSFTTTKSEG
jgi:NDP-sugar pyrophosphorylase family protein